ncbi:hypothetical protein A2313_01870 [Candidatus Roizmanbacteria bacterium RIFOXYB2_FULL_41_10]|uniref:ATP-cone domain-containing protein n=1 Tax=Candidatus Roizmanbacteria bacterium RIFOXYA1_FULL_41_12 TaxID=1802082 RepID=A0A1F7KA58_9BACT|nr:MAG: hypothetical protein A2209_00120 [Candidatus Roizmanbacteria bacterium RIFOXYA1_FULL_41_12]OGK66680.1 MAG: hypothetical protein A2262_03515 [Candidatus Roizmanbacteria bacterium RIFOXYA2_FULL_41_8]OGK67536.1 MAG: hypothetical protein A2377_01675 [Candidatus Roizmanbacteria bacterium RIFOXYB1_FULL_41_27]OGK70942.1 MAG: hypothetical protein A2313_01870 [Candidatus Roizmanbacteria bacterium RIFOXYB2_FULL_41_10]OGK71192.1 MAG: hypothetical protein A2403_00405 [Candidatus Roizmanbacteria bac
MKDLYVIKASGERELYSETKIKEAISRAQVPLEYHERVLSDLKTHLYENIPTSEIYNLISQFLIKSYPVGEIRFRLKKAIMELGPTGYPFEVFIGHLLKEYGYQTEVGIEMPGSCVNHEVDVLAKKDNRVYFVECKYHNQQGVRSDIKVVLYVHARGEDLMAKLPNDKVYGTWIFTNTKFSTDAIAYAECKKMRLTGWSYPQKKDSLQTMIETKNLYPITVLHSLTTEHRRRLLLENIVLVKELVASPNVYRRLDMGRETLEKFKNECRQLGCDQ